MGVMPFEVRGSGVTSADTVNITNRIIAELSSWGTLSVVQGSGGAEYIIRGTISRQGAVFILSAETVNAGTGQILNEYSEQIAVGGEASLFLFCAKAVERVPLPNYLVGLWRSSLPMPDGPVVCIIEFKSDRTVVVERYDTWEHKQNNAIRYEGYGAGAYSYAGFANRHITVNSQAVRIDAIVNVNLTLEETLPEQTAVNQPGLSLVFNSEKTAFDIVNGLLPCGTNHDGPSVYPSSVLGFTSFNKIQ
ncbi:MAG: hypothetical protein LBI12_00210 [Treponema sp.]|nr:hypothetical protein [Treponema sp.]